MTNDSVGPIPRIPGDPAVDEATAIGAHRAPLRAVVFDWGGVLTASLDGAMSQWARQDGATVDHFRTVLGSWTGYPWTSPAPALDGAGPEWVPVADSPVHRLERGEIDVVEFEEQLAVELSRRGATVRSSGLIDRFLAGLEHLDERMLGLIRRLRSAGYATALLSNSWGDHYPDRLWQGLFDAIVISGRVGMRKPEGRIFHYVAEQLGLDPTQCVMVDDLAPNVAGAVATGMVGIVHISWEETLGELEAVLDLDLRGADPGRTP
jgi:epoxide hydrolase-like predicted phosphatase